jgi:hypothetical protein
LDADLTGLVPARNPLGDDIVVVAGEKSSRRNMILSSVAWRGYRFGLLRNRRDRAKVITSGTKRFPVRS